MSRGMAVRVQTRRPSRAGARALDARAANDRIAEKAKRLQFVSGVPMLCECSARGCRTIVPVALAAYREIRCDSAAFLVAPGHAADALSVGPSGDAIASSGRRGASGTLRTGGGGGFLAGGY